MEPQAHGVGTLYPLAVAVLCEDRLADIGAGEIVGKNLIHNPADIRIDIPARNPFLIIGGDGGDGKVIATVPVRRNHHIFGVEG